MRVLFGMVLGALLTVGSAFFYDTWPTGPSANKTPTVEQRPMVNWDVVVDRLARRAPTDERGLDHAVNKVTSR